MRREWGGRVGEGGGGGGEGGGGGFFFNDTATTEIYTLSLHDALPICAGNVRLLARQHQQGLRGADTNIERFIFEQLDELRFHRSHPGVPRKHSGKNTDARIV